MRRLRLFKKKTIIEGTRKIKINDPQSNSIHNYPGNEVTTSKYNLFTFLPKNLFEQFHRLANAYFLLLLCLQLVPQISSLPAYTTIVPLCFVLILTAIKDGIDDLGRHRSDKIVNNRMTQVISQNDFVDKKWKDVQVGDMIQIINEEFITADVVILSTSEPNGLCFIETAELDGETNLKVRQSIKEIQPVGDDIEQLSRFDGEIECECPNNNLNKFEGNLKWKNEIYPLTNQNILLRGTKLRNTQWIVGIVCYAGSDSKLMKNTNKPTFKRSHIDRLLDRIIIGIFLFLLFICCTMTICSIIWEMKIGSHFRVYLPWDSYISKDTVNGSIQLGFLGLFSYIITLSTVVPISLYVSIEFVRLLQSKWIDWDVNMFYQFNNIRAHVRTTTLNEELGQIQYIFSDKTGTLTQNLMTFRKCSINGKIYGSVLDENGNEIQDPTKLEAIELQNENEDFVWFDQKLVDAIANNDEDVERFFTLLSLCHTVMPEQRDGLVIYQAQSPDENALVSASRSFQFAFLNRTQSTITIQIKDQQQTFNLLNILDFNNDRQRMSVIVEKDGEICLYCKGADTKIKERLANSQDELIQITDQHLNTFANDSLRTLCLAWKKLTKSEYDLWATKLNLANTSMESRDEQIGQLYEQIEQNLLLLGATAIEDRLQDGVADCLQRLTQAGIKIWVLTGDKIETAFNIGLSCKLLTNDMEIETIEGKTEEEIENRLDSIRNSMIDKIEELFDVIIDDRNQRLTWKTIGIDPSNFDVYRKDDNQQQEQRISTNSTTRSVRFSVESINDQSINEDSFDGFALLITGQSLIYALNENLKLKFLEIATMCKSVICCRVTPMQKAEVVELVMKHEKQISLAIGDGANDVSMIQKANIGVGISGQEGQQAVLASDFTFGQFRYLERLLLIHGRLSYLRISKFLRYFFYKNFAFTFSHFWFSFFSAYSAQTVYDPVYGALYNTLFTTFPVLVLSIIDRDVNDTYSLNKPYLYKSGPNNELFNKKVLCKSIIHGMISSLMIFFLCYFSLQNVDLLDLQSFGFIIGTILIVVVNLENGLETWYWTKLYHLALWATLIIYFLFHLFLYSTYFIRIFQQNYPYVGVAQLVLRNPTFWLVLLVNCVVLLLPMFAKRFYEMRFTPNDRDKARYNHKYRYEERAAFLTHIKQKKTKSKRLQRSSYAFSQETGWGPLITSGIMQVKQIPNSRLSQDSHMHRKSRLTLDRFTGTI